MDLKSLIAKMDQIESKKFLTESEKKDSSWTDMKGNKHSATKVKGKSYGNQPEPKKVDNEGKPKKKVKEGLGIADALMEAFGLEEQTTVSSPPGAPTYAYNTAIDGVTGSGITNPYDPNSPEGRLFPSLSPRDQEWLTRGGQAPKFANDAAMKARMPDKGQPTANVNVTSTQTKTAAQADADYAASQSTKQPGTAKSANDGDAGDAEAQAAQSGKNASAPNAAGAPLKWPTTRDEIIAFQMYNNLKPDGLIGQKTMAALQQAGATPPAGFRPVANRVAPQQAAQTQPQQGAGGGRSTGVGGATADQMAAANTPVPPRPGRLAHWQNRVKWDQQYATTHNPDGSPKMRGARQSASTPSASAALQIPAPTGQGRPGPTRAAAAGTDPNNPLNQPTREDVSWLRKLAGL